MLSWMGQQVAQLAGVKHKERNLGLETIDLRVRYA